MDKIKLVPRSGFEGASGNLSLLLGSIAAMRGIDEEEFLRWLYSDLEDQLNAIPLNEQERRAFSLISNVRPGDRVIIYGDYDVDGLSATTLALELMLELGASVRYFIPHRSNEGYGFHISTAKRIAMKGCDLLVVVDCGTKDVGALDLIAAAGIPTVIFDHHLPGEKMPGGVLVNPHCFDAPSPLTALCATGVLWAWIWRTSLMNRSWAMGRLDLACLATVADCMDLSVPLNRCIVREGLEVIRKSPRRGIGVLLSKLGVDVEGVDEEVLSMKVIPCLNAPGRLGLAEDAVRLLFPGDAPVEGLADRVVSMNEERRRLSSMIMRDAQGDVHRHVYHGSNWPVGVLSSVASRLCCERGRPVALVAPTEGGLRGTLRIPNGSGDAVGLLSNIAEHLSAFGGHKYAAGFSVDAERWDLVRDKLEGLLRAMPSEDQRVDVLDWPLSMVGQDIEEDVERLKPFGMGNPAPLLFHRGGFSVEPMGKTGRVSRLVASGRELVAFASQSDLEGLDLVGFVYRPKLEFWRGKKRLKLYLERAVLAGPEGGSL
ncbi:single-stranded-DNA-specific exonuclease RecJ [Thermanaerovibrio velox]|nr:DHH family phosphoesterase [Thermanaerovibrio velox]